MTLDQSVDTEVVRAQTPSSVFEPIWPTDMFTLCHYYSGDVFEVADFSRNILQSPQWNVL